MLIYLYLYPSGDGEPSSTFVGAIVGVHDRYFYGCVSACVCRYVSVFAHILLSPVAHTYIYNTCMHIGIHTYIHTYIHIHIQTYIHTYIRTHVHIYKHAHVHTHPLLSPVAHTYIHKYIHA